MTLSVAMVVERFPDEPFLAQQVRALLDRSVDVHVLCQTSEADGDAWLHLDGVDMTGRIHPWPDRGRYPALAGASLLALLAAVRRRRLGLIKPALAAIAAERGGDDGETTGRNPVGRLLFDLRLLAVDPDVVHFQFGDLARARTHIVGAVEAAVTASFRGYDLAYAGLDEPDFYDRLWPALDGAHTLGRDLLAVAEQRGAQADLPWTIIAPAIDADRFKPPNRRLDRHDADRPLRILSVGRLHWKKGLTDGLAAVADLVGRGRSVTYRIVGGGPAEEQLRWTIADLGLAPVVELLGPCPGPEVRRQLAWADVFLHPSHTEGFANAVLEAQAMAVPVVCTDAEGLAENVVDGETGLVVPRRRPPALAEAVARLADDPDLRARMGAAGRRRVVDHFDLAAQTDAFVEFFEAAVERAGARGRPAGRRGGGR